MKKGWKVSALVAFLLAILFFSIVADLFKSTLKASATGSCYPETNSLCIGGGLKKNIIITRAKAHVNPGVKYRIKRHVLEY